MRKLYVLIIIILASTINLHAQDPYMQKGNPDAEKQAEALTRLYQDDLGMTIEQGNQFMIKAEEYVIRRNEVRSQNLSTKKKLALLRELSRMETAEMRNILTLPQYRAYKRLKKDLQPIQVTVTDSN